MTQELTVERLGELRSAGRAEREARKEARRVAPDYRPIVIFLSPFEDERLVVEEFCRTHPDADGDLEPVVYAVISPRDHLCTPSSRAAGEAWQREAVASAARRSAEAAIKYAAAEEAERQTAAEVDHVDAQAEPERHLEPIAVEAVLPERRIERAAPEPEEPRRGSGEPAWRGMGPGGWMR